VTPPPDPDRSAPGVGPDDPEDPGALVLEVVRLDPSVPLPTYAHPGDAGADLTTRVDVTLAPGERARVPTGLVLALPAGHVGLVHPRSGLAARHGVTVLNAPGTIDEGFRGEVEVLLVNHDPRESVTLRRGDRVAQLVVQRYERVRLVEVTDVEALPATTRGSGGYGSTGGFDVAAPAAPTVAPDPATTTTTRSTEEDHP